MLKYNMITLEKNCVYAMFNDLCKTNTYKMQYDKRIKYGT